MKLVVLALLFAACSGEAPSAPPAPPASRTLPNENIEATVNWGLLCLVGAEVTPYRSGANSSMVTIRTARGNLLILSVPTWQMKLVEEKCAEFAARPSRTIGPRPIGP